MYSIAQLKPGVAINFNGEPHIIVRSQFSKQARQGGTMKTVMRNLITGSNIQHTFAGNDKCEPADLAKSKCQFLYRDGETFFFMNKDSYEQYEITGELVGDNHFYLTDGCDVNLSIYEGSPIGVEVAPKVELRVVDAPPGVKGDTAQGGSKPVTLETGLVVNAPLFINEGDIIRVNTAEAEYVERV